MISFRYHVVSLAAVFLALAAGILLGSGPLQGRLTPIGGGDSEGVSAEQALADLTDTDEALAALAASAAVGTLDGQTVAVVALPGAHADDLAEVQSALGEAGATPGAEVTVHLDEVNIAYLQTFTQQLAGYLPAPPPGNSPESVLMMAILTLVTGTDTSDGVLPELLVAGDQPLVTVIEGPAATAVVAVGPRETSEWDLASMVRALDSVPAVLVGATTSAGDGLVDVLRADEPIPTTVNGVATRSGAALVPLALAAEISGEPGHWGTGQHSPAPPLVR